MKTKTARNIILALMAFAFLHALSSIYINVKSSDYDCWWQLATIGWIFNSFIQMLIIGRYEDESNNK